MRLTTPASEAIRPRSTVATWTRAAVAVPRGGATGGGGTAGGLLGRGGLDVRRGGLRAAGRVRNWPPEPPRPLPRRAIPGAAARLPSTAAIALCWSRMMSTSRTRATTNRVSDAVTHVLVMSCRDWPAIMPNSSTPSDAAPKIRVIRDR